MRTLKGTMYGVIHHNLNIKEKRMFLKMLQHFSVINEGIFRRTLFDIFGKTDISVSISNFLHNVNKFS